MREFLNHLPKDKTKINWNKNLIPMKLFLSFLTVDVERSRSHLGSDTGWTRLNGENGLVVSGGIVKNTEYLDNLRYGKNLDNPYNNYVNPFYLFGILNEEGKRFFRNYYKDEIADMLAKSKQKIVTAKAHLDLVGKNNTELIQFWSNLS